MRFQLGDATVLVDGAESLAVGDRVKLRFVGPRKDDAAPCDEHGRELPWRFSGENMWVEVDMVFADRYGGWLRNRPLAIAGSQGDRVEFLARHVVEIKRVERQ